MKFELYQVSRRFPTVADSAKFYGISPSYTSIEARQAFRSKKYVLVATVEANNLQQMATIANGDRSNPLLAPEAELRSISIGDIAFNYETGFYHIKSQTAWERIKI